MKLKFGVIGTGHMGHYHVNVLSMLAPQLIEFIGIYDTDQKRASEISGTYKIKSFNNAEELMAGCDAVSIAVPTVDHYNIGKKALESGLHVLIEKPITINVQQAEELVAIAEKKKLVLQAGHVERFNGAVQELKNIVTNPVLWEARRMGPNPKRSLDVSVVYDLMIHDIDICLNVVNSPVVSVEACGQKVISAQEDVASALLYFKNGCIATITSSRVTQEKFRTLSISQHDSYIHLDFTTQDLQIVRQGSSMTTTSADNIKYRQESVIERLFVHKDNPLKCQFQHFIRTILGEEPPHVLNSMDIETMRITGKIIEKIRGK